MLVKKNISKIILLFILLLSLNVITVLLGDSNSTVTVVNKTEYNINAVIDGKSYPGIAPDLSAIHTMRAKPSVLVVAAYSPGQEVEGLAERTLTLPYSGGNEVCECDDEGDPHGRPRVYGPGRCRCRCGDGPQTDDRQGVRRSGILVEKQRSF